MKRNRKNVRLQYNGHKRVVWDVFREQPRKELTGRTDEMTERRCGSRVKGMTEEMLRRGSMTRKQNNRNDGQTCEGRSDSMTRWRQRNGGMEGARNSYLHPIQVVGAVGIFRMTRRDVPKKEPKEYQPSEKTKEDVRPGCGPKEEGAARNKGAALKGGVARNKSGETWSGGLECAAQGAKHTISSGVNRQLRC
eukprot:jgi/Psemu1/43419/gm1.43419_g